MPLKNTLGSELKFTISDLKSVCFSQSKKATCVYLRLVHSCNCRVKFKVVQKLVPDCIYMAYL